jgi:DNA-binding response OmpR family regulator
VPDVDARNAVVAGLTVAVVEDDEAIATQLARGLSRAGCRPVIAGSGAAALDAADADVVLLDLGLPDLDGVELCRLLRRRSSAPIIVITARSEIAQRVEALDAGADDYLVKPFGFEELLARMRAVLRRTSGDQAAVIAVGSLAIDVAARRVRIGDGVLPLTGKEFDILVCLALEPGRVVSREEIFDRVWDEHWYGPRKVLDVHIAALRRKLGDPALIQTVYGRGFRLEP